MQVEVGSIVEGKVTGITNFGAFILMANGETGMVHISEISNSYVKEIGDYLKEDEEVKVKVLSVANDGKISLSIKQCMTEEEQAAQASQNQNRRPPQRRRNSGPREIVWEPKAAENTDNMSFEDMMTRFKQDSNDKMGDLKKASEPRRSRRSYNNTPR